MKSGYFMTFYLSLPVLYTPNPDIVDWGNHFADGSCFGVFQGRPWKGIGMPPVLDWSSFCVFSSSFGPEARISVDNGIAGPSLGSTGFWSGGFRLF